MTIATENLPDDIATLKQIIADLTRDAVVAQAEITKLKFSWPAIGGPSLVGPRRRWRTTSPSLSWRSRRWRPTKPNGWRHTRRQWQR